jgi:integrase
MKRKKLPKYVSVRNGVWSVRRAYPTGERDDKGHRTYIQIVRTCPIQTTDEAKRVSDAIDAAYRRASIRPSDPQTVSDAVSEFVRVKKAAVDPRTAEYYRWMHEKYIKGSRFGRLPLEAVTPKMTQDFYEGLASPAMIKKLNTFLSMAFGQCIRWKLLDANPCSGVILPAIPLTEVAIMEEDEARAFMKVCLEDPRLHVLAFALESWMRPGEYLALPRRNLNLEDQTAFVERAVAFPRGGGYRYKVPKTKSSKRIIRLSPQIIEAIDIPKKGELVFPGRNGLPRRYGNLGRREMALACERAGLKKYSIYSFVTLGFYRPR